MQTLQGLPTALNLRFGMKVKVWMLKPNGLFPKKLDLSVPINVIEFSIGNTLSLIGRMHLLRNEMIIIFR